MDQNRQIRVFISSTFMDMQAEREYLTRVVFPRLRKKCSDRGVSFYAIDLRWGITEKESQANRTLEICLDQVKQCIPYFIGMIGNRYGWIPTDGNLAQQYPWLTDHPGISATEMEIRCYFREAMEQKNCSLFAIKGESLLDPDFDDGQETKLRELTQSITAQTGTAPFVYESMEALGQAVYENILGVLDREFPLSACTPEHRLQQYVHQIEHYDDSHALGEMERANWQNGGNRFLFARRDPMAFEVMENALVRFEHIVLVEERGMEPLCNRYLYNTIHQNLTWSNPQIKSTCIMLDATEHLRTPVGIMDALCNWLKTLAPAGEEYPWPETGTKGVARLQQLVTLAVYMLQDILPERQLLVCVSGLHLMDKNSPWYCLPFMAPLLRDGLRLVLTTADPEQAVLLKTLGVPCRKFPIRLSVSEKAGFFGALIRCFELEGKHLDADLADDLLNSPVLDNMETASFVGNYLKNYVIFQHLPQRIAALSGQDDAYSAVWQLQKQTLEPAQTERIVALAARIYRVIRTLRLPEADLDRIFTQCGTSRILFLEALNLIRPFLAHDGTGLCVYSEACDRALDKIFLDQPQTGEHGLVDVVMEKLDMTFSCLDDQYALVGYLYDHAEKAQLIRLVTDSRWLEFAARMDPQLIRMAWRALEALGAPELKTIYTESGHLCGMKASREVYDVLMRMELAVTGTDHFECFLDIPFAYSTDSEKELKHSWDATDRKTVDAFKQCAGDHDADYLRGFYQRYKKARGLNPFFAVYLWEILCDLFAKRGELTEDDRQIYLMHACRVCAPRLIADALHHFDLATGPHRLLR